MHVLKTGCWQIFLVGTAMLGLAACANESDQSTGNAVPPGPLASAEDLNASGIGGAPLSSDEIFNKEVGNTVYFATDGYDLSPDAQAALTRQAQWLLQNPVRTAVLEGHADERGTREYNLALGERRAESARAYLVALGVEATRLSTTSFGKEQPLCGESGEACWQQNRRAVTALNP